MVTVTGPVASTGPPAVRSASALMVVPWAAMGIVGVDHVQVAAPPGCEADARRFYGELLGMPELTKPPVLAARGGCWFQAGAQELHVGVERDFRPARKAHPGLVAESVADLEAIGERLTAAGADVVWDDANPGVTRFHVHDPWGNRLELVAR